MIAGGYWRKKGKQGWVSLLGDFQNLIYFFPVAAQKIPA